MHRFALRALRRPRYRIPGFVIDWRAGMPLPVGGYARTSDATLVGPDGVFRQVGPGVLRTSWLDLDGDGRRETPALRLEPGATNLLHESSNFGASAWGAGTGLVVTPATSIIAGRTAHKHANDGTGSNRNRNQVVGTFSGQRETLYLIVEGVDAATTSIGLRDQTQATFVHRATFTWGTGAVSRADGYDAGGTHGAIRLADSGPNGGPVYLLWLTATGVAGNARSAFIYPTGITTNTHAAILHHAQLVESEVATLPIVTGAGSVARSRDTLYLDLPAQVATPGTPMAVYSAWIHGMDGAGGLTRPGVWSIVQASGTGARLGLYLSATDRLTLEHAVDSSQTRLTQVNVSPTIGDRVETVSTFREDGSGRLIASINGGALAGADLPALAPADAWSAPRLYIGSRGSAAGVFDYEALRVFAGPLSGSDEALLRFMRGDV